MSLPPCLHCGERRTATTVRTDLGEIVVLTCKCDAPGPKAPKQ